MLHKSRWKLVLVIVGLSVLPVGFGSTSHFVIADPGMNSGNLRVTSSPALPTTILVDGSTRDDWGLNWLTIPSGNHVVSFTDVPGYATPAPTTVTVPIGSTGTATGSFAPQGILQVTTSPPVPSTIKIDGVPRDDWGVYAWFTPGSHTVCWAAVAGYDVPPCQTASVVSGQTTVITGSFTTDQNASGQTNVGLLRVTSSPAVPTTISLANTVADDWGLNWVELSPGTYTISFSGVPGYQTPASQTVTITAGQTTTVTGAFTQYGSIQAQTSPSANSMISIKGPFDSTLIARDNYGVWTEFLPGYQYEVCYSPVPAVTFSPSSCQYADPSAGSTSDVTDYDSPTVCTGTPSITGDYPWTNGTYDYILTDFAAGYTPNSGCSPDFQFYFWNGSAWEIFRPYSPSPTAWLDTHNLEGTAYVYVGVHNHGSTGGNDTWSPQYISAPIIHHSDVPNSYDTRYNATEHIQAEQTDISQQTVDSHTGQSVLALGGNTYWISTYIVFDSYNNHPACNNGANMAVYVWQNAYAQNVVGYNASENDFFQAGHEYTCTGGTGRFFVALTSGQMQCYNGSTPTVFGWTASQIASITTYDSQSGVWTLAATPASDVAPQGPYPFGGVYGGGGQFFKGCLYPAPAEGIVDNINEWSNGYQLQFYLNSNEMASIPLESNVKSIMPTNMHLTTEINGMQTPYQNLSYSGVGGFINDPANVTGNAVNGAFEDSYFWNDVAQQWVGTGIDSFLNSVFNGATPDTPGTEAIDIYCNSPYSYGFGWYQGYLDSVVEKSDRAHLCGVHW